MKEKKIFIHIYKRPKTANIGDILIEYKPLVGRHYVCDMPSYAWHESVFVVSIMLRFGWQELDFVFKENKGELEKLWGIEL